MTIYFQCASFWVEISSIFCLNNEFRSLKKVIRSTNRHYGFKYHAKSYNYFYWQWFHFRSFYVLKFDIKPWNQKCITNFYNSLWLFSLFSASVMLWHFQPFVYTRRRLNNSFSKEMRATYTFRILLILSEVWNESKSRSVNHMWDWYFDKSNWTCTFSWKLSKRAYLFYSLL